MIPLTRPTLPKIKTIKSKLKNIFDTGMITNSKYVKEFEKRCADFLEVKNAVAVSSGTAALVLSLKALNLKGEVILPSFTFTSAGHSLLWCGLKPVFIDIDPRNFNIDADLLEKKITSETAAIFPSHVFGNPCNIDKIQKIAGKYNLKVIYDAAHAFGSRYKGQSVAGFGNAACYSFTPTKVLTTGEGGLIATNDDSLAEKLVIGRNNGDSFNREEEFLGITARMGELNAILGIESIKILKKSLKRRLEIISLYKKALGSVPGIYFQEIPQDSFSVYKDFAILVEKEKFGMSRNDLLRELLARKIEAKVYFDPPLHKKKVYGEYKDEHLPNTEFINSRIMSLPLYSHMAKESVSEVANLIKGFYSKK